MDLHVLCIKIILVGKSIWCHKKAPKNSVAGTVWPKTRDKEVTPAPTQLAALLYMETNAGFLAKIIL
jgi:hypothetical protein